MLSESVEAVIFKGLVELEPFDCPNEAPANMRENNRFFFSFVAVLSGDDKGAGD